jgi:adenylate cyclase
MDPHRPALQHERLMLLARIVTVGAAIGAVYGAVLAHEDAPLAGLAIGALNGTLIAFAIAGMEIFLLRGGSAPVRWLRGLPFGAVLALKTLVYAAIASVLPAAHLLTPAWPGLRHAPTDLHTELMTIGFSLAVSFVFVAVVQAAGLVGRSTFLDLLRGRYRHPRLERRFFLFVDMVGSTAVAERLGPLEAHRLLARVFAALAEPVAARRGEIYQYVGDEIVVTWTEANGVPAARPVHCFFEMEAALLEQSAQFRAAFGEVPRLRGALHLGEVVAGEVGEQRRAIVFHGDAINATSRLEQATRELGCRFLVSGDALRALGPLRGLRCRDMGELALRGRQQPLRAWAVEQAPATRAQEQPAAALDTLPSSG